VNPKPRPRPIQFGMFHRGSGREARLRLTGVASLVAGVLAISATACSPQPKSAGSLPSSSLEATPTADGLHAVTISGPSPFAQCDVGALLPSSHVYENAEVEPSLAANPVDAANLVAAYQQDRWSDGAARGMLVASTTDGGMTWRPQSLAFSQCAGGDQSAVRVGDPWVVFGNSGTAWVVATASDGVHAAVSLDKGVHWRTSIIYRNSEGRSADKPSIAADPFRPMVAYATWYTIDRSTMTVSDWFAQTTDGGVTWNPPSRLATSESMTVAGKTRSLGPVSPLIIATRQPSALYIFSVYEPFSTVLLPPFGLGFQRSLDGGRTWSHPRMIHDILTVGQTVDENNGHVVRTGAEVVNAASDAHDGTLYVVWQDARFESGRHDDVAISRSDDGGDHWSEPVRVNAVHGVPALIPAIATDVGGHVAVSYMDWRALDPKDRTTLPARYWLAVSNDKASSFRERALSSAFDLMAAPDATGKFVGDYDGLAACAQGFCAAYATTNSGGAHNPTDIQFSTLSA
jgi:hypothetical protein